ncbi:hypothetical protein ACRALDRAFT_206777, partial [Sodiomyces alcalophilus JCM 7366]|uniref:uncharacterized protein n=1 Tax=Sodiomyces alcalophilus JCM 7366 TaxID=591952 RepID=UPI0039B5FD22
MAKNEVRSTLRATSTVSTSYYVSSPTCRAMLQRICTTLRNLATNLPHQSISSIYVVNLRRQSTSSIYVVNLRRQSTSSIYVVNLRRQSTDTGSTRRRRRRRRVEDKGVTATAATRSIERI